jgi:hypothetical protein
LRELPGDILYNWVDIMSGAFMHMYNYHTYVGFQLETRNTVATWTSTIPSPLSPTRPSSPVAPEGLGALRPDNYEHVALEDGALEELGAPAEPVEMRRSPSPVLPWYMH